MPACQELGRRKLLGLFSVSAAAYITGCYPAAETPLPPEQQPSPTLTPHPPAELTPQPTAEQKLSTPVPTSPRKGPLPTVIVPELIPLKVKTATPVSRAPERTPTPEPEIDHPPTFNLIWKKEVPRVSIIPNETVFADSEKSYLYINGRLICTSNTNGDQLWTWTNPERSALKYNNPGYDPNYLFVEYSGSLQISGNRLTAQTLITAINKSTGTAQNSGWPQPEKGNQQFFYHDGAIQRLTLRGGTIETDCELYNKDFVKLWGSPGRVYHTVAEDNLAVINTSTFDKVKNIKVVGLRNKSTERLVFKQFPDGEAWVNGYDFEESSMYAVVAGKLYSVDLRGPDPNWVLTDPQAGRIEEIRVKAKSGNNLVVSDDSKFLFVDKKSGKIVQKFARKPVSYLELAGDTLLVSDQKDKITYGFNASNSSTWENKEYTLSGIYGKHKNTIAAFSNIQGDTGLYLISSLDGRLLWSRRGFGFHAALAGRAFVFSNQDSNKIRVIDMETGNEVKEERFPDNIVSVISPKRNLVIVQISGQQGMLYTFAT